MVITNIFLLYYSEIRDQICIDLSTENDRKLQVAAAHTSGNALSANTECSHRKTGCHPPGFVKRTCILTQSNVTAEIVKKAETMPTVLACSVAL